MTTASELRRRILSGDGDRKPEPYDVPEWGPDPIYIRVLSAQAQVDIADQTDTNLLPARLLISCIVDEYGQQVLEEEDMPELMKRDFPVIMRVFTYAAKQNGFSTKELEEAMASFAPAPDESSSTE